MNFCGGPVEHQVMVLSDDELDSKLADPRHLCCAVQHDEEEELPLYHVHQHPPPTTEIITTVPINSRKNANASRMNSVWSGAEDEDEPQNSNSNSKLPVALALDVIQQTLEKKKQLHDLTETPKKSTSAPAAQPLLRRTLTPPAPLRTPPSHHQHRTPRIGIDTNLYADNVMEGNVRTPSPNLRTPSPMLLNPLSIRTTGWVREEQEQPTPVQPVLVDDIRLASRRRRSTSNPLENAAAAITATGRATPKSTNTSRSTTSSKLLCPDLHSSGSSLESLMKRLQAGFNVRLLQDRKVGPVFLYLHYDRSHLCIIRRNGEGDDDDDYDERDEKKVIDEWIELPIGKILRLEVGKTSHPLASASNKKNIGTGSGTNKHFMTFFSIVVNQDANIIYYDFEADSPLEREVLVSTLMVVLDQAQNPTLKMQQQPPLTAELDPYQDCFVSGGTMDQPIPCSPSLELLESESLPNLSPRKRTLIYDGDSSDGTETSLAVIHLEHVDSAPLLPTVDEILVSQCSNTLGGETSLSFATDTDLSYDMNGGVVGVALTQTPAVGVLTQTPPEDAKSTATALVANNNKLDFEVNAQGLPGGWSCADADICTLALRDLAETCSGIFGKREKSYEAEQRIIVEEYIASALGSPSAMYSYLTEGDVWNAESAPAVGGKNEKGGLANGDRVRNRASSLNAQATRLRTLRNEMTFVAALKQSKERMYFVQTTQSFDDMSRSGKGRKVKAATDVANSFHTSALLKHVVGNMMMPDQSGPVQEEKEEVAYYDSDPEDARPRTMKKGPRRVTADRLNRVEGNDEKSPRHEALSGVGFENLTSNKKVSKKLDEEVIVEMVQVRVV